jgi:hypothetical protein
MEHLAHFPNVYLKTLTIKQQKPSMGKITRHEPSVTKNGEGRFGSNTLP